MSEESKNEVYEKKNNIFSDRNYIEILYNEKNRPKTNYPIKFAGHLFEKYYKKKGSLLDLGCGRGDMLQAFHKIGFEASGVDLSPSSAEINKPLDVKVSDLAKDALPYDTNTFDFIFSKSVIEHIHDPFLLIKESFRVLKKGGKSVILTPSWVHNAWGPFYLDHTHVTPFTQFSLKNLMILSGYKNVKVIHFYQLPFVWKSKFNRLIAKLIEILPIRYSPMYESNLPHSINLIVRHSKEMMLLAYGDKPE